MNNFLSLVQRNVNIRVLGRQVFNNSVWKIEPRQTNRILFAHSSFFSTKSKTPGNSCGKSSCSSNHKSPVSKSKQNSIKEGRPKSFWEKTHALDRIFKNNEKWRKEKEAEDPNFFKKMAEGQQPAYLWIGCADSRVPAEEITGLGPGEVFVHRNIANMVVNTDMNILSVVEYAVEHLKVRDIIICGHYNCGGIAAALQNKDYGTLDNWLKNIRDVARLHMKELNEIEGEKEQLRRMVEVNVIEQCMNVYKMGVVQNRQAKHGYPRIHGLVYDFENGKLKKMDIDFKSYVSRYSGVFGLTPLSSVEGLQANMIRSFVDKLKNEKGLVNIVDLKKVMIDEPELFNQKDIQESIAFATEDEKNKDMVSIEKVAKYFESE